MPHIGRSILPSSEPRILTPIGDLQVRALPDLDTHALLYKGRMIASHPNGYSCRVLAERMVAGDKAHALAQHNYILACGGLAKTAGAIACIMDEIKA